MTQIMSNLNKENFWNAMHDECPEAVEKFCVWIDDYKLLVGWRGLFGDKVKFHDLPYEMQMGIMNRFFIEVFASREEYILDGQRGDTYHGEMKDALQELQRRITKRKATAN